MNAAEFKKLSDLDKGLKEGQPVTVRWTANHCGYEGKGKIVRVNSKSVRVALIEPVNDQFGGEYPIGRELNIPRIADMNRWSQYNCVLPPGWGDRMTEANEREEKPFVLRPNAPPAGMTTEQRWTKAAVDMFVGRKIVAARYLSAEEAENLGWHERAIVLQLDDGNLIFPSQDDEGNGPGSLFTNDDKEPIFPVLHLRRG